ncbi:MAG TPA: phosphatidylserine decarboxylase family protein [Syntrophales bacterium]|nr:phosphatidylserine decarboxylase family protein [Syntrophales bacterium]HRT70572.1 phosphatidylserine decarboxylase family protein [Syntrophales bacterium]
MKRKDSMIVGEGYPFIVPPAALTVVFAYAGLFWLTTLCSVLTLFVVWFFRNPDRAAPSGEGVFVSPADGRVLKVEDVPRGENLTGPFRKVSIFMNVFDVHVNRAPCSGTVTAIHYHKGRFLSANLDKASELNEKNTVVIRREEGEDVLVSQIAGLIARRIVCWVGEGVHVERGDRIGMIRFGSRVEVFLPQDAKVSVEAGTRVKAGETIIGWLR